MHLQIGDGGCRKIQGKRLPVVAAVPRDIYAGIGTGIKQVFPLVVFADYADHFVFRKSVDDLLPTLAVVIGAKDVRRSGGSRSTEGDIGRRQIVMRGFDVEDLTGFGQSGRRNVLPGLSHHRE